MTHLRGVSASPAPVPGEALARGEHVAAGEELVAAAVLAAAAHDAHLGVEREHDGGRVARARRRLVHSER